METKKLIETLHSYERKVLPVLEKLCSLKEIAEKTKLKEVEVMRALQWLQNKKIINLKGEIKEVVDLDKNGFIYLEKGLPEKRFLKAIEKEEVGKFQKKKPANLLKKGFATEKIRGRKQHCTNSSTAT